MKTIKEIFNDLHTIDSDLAHQFLYMVIERYGRFDPRIAEIFNNGENHN